MNTFAFQKLFSTRGSPDPWGVTKHRPQASGVFGALLDRNLKRPAQADPQPKADVTPLRELLAALGGQDPGQGRQAKEEVSALIAALGGQDPGQGQQAKEEVSALIAALGGQDPGQDRQAKEEVSSLIAALGGQNPGQGRQAGKEVSALIAALVGQNPGQGRQAGKEVSALIAALVGQNPREARALNAMLRERTQRLGTNARAVTRLVARRLSQEGANPEELAHLLAPAGARASNQVQNFVRQAATQAQGAAATLLAGREDVPQAANPLEVFKEVLGALGLDLSEMRLDPAQLPLVGQLMAQSGFQAQQIEAALEKIEAGKLGLDQVLAAIGSAPAAQAAPQPTLTTAATARLGRLLTEAGLKQEAVQEVLSQLSASQTMSLSQLKTALTSASPENLKSLKLEKADLENLGQLLTQMGLDEQKTGALLTRLAQARGNISLESLINQVKALTSAPQGLAPAQVETITALVEGLKLNHTLELKPYFNRVVSLVAALSGEGGESAAQAETPGVAVLRGADTPQTSLDTAPRDTAQAAPSRETAPPSNLSEAVVRQVTEKIFHLAKNNRHQLSLRLDPPELGRIRINLTYQNHNLRASIIAENALVKETLDQNSAELKAALASQGVNLERFTVLTENSPAAGFASQERQRESQQRRERARLNQAPAQAAGEQETPPQTLAAARNHQGRLSVLA